MQGGDTSILLLVVCVGVASFWLGRLSIGNVADTRPPSVQMVNSVQTREFGATVVVQELTATGTTRDGVGTENTVTEGGYVASKNGTKYHLPWCTGAKRIKDENKVWFKTKEDAEKAGLTPASNCKGI